MIITYAHLKNFRNHEDTRCDFSPRMNVFLGDNGQGKTNILEGLSFLCLTKSFYAAADAVALQKGKQFFEITSGLSDSAAHTSSVRVAYDDALKQKKFFINDVPVEKLSSVIGKFPIVILSPENNMITFGSPAERRKFIDLVIAQSSRVYADDMIEYKQVLRQRNAVLSSAAGAPATAALEPWDEMLARYGARIIQKRARFAAEFLPYIKKTYAEIAEQSETPHVEYMPAIPLEETATAESIQAGLMKKMQKKRQDELRMGTSLVGPHREECFFSLNGLQLKQYASQGQHKTFLIALKVAEFYYLQERCAEAPLFLLDDVFSELDEYRCQRLLALVESLGQTFITTTSEKTFGNVIPWDGDHKKFSVRSGSITRGSLAA